MFLFPECSGCWGVELCYVRAPGTACSDFARWCTATFAAAKDRAACRHRCCWLITSRFGIWVQMGWGSNHQVGSIGLNGGCATIDSHHFARSPLLGLQHNCVAPHCVDTGVAIKEACEARAARMNPVSAHVLLRWVAWGCMA